MELNFYFNIYRINTRSLAVFDPTWYQFQVSQEMSQSSKRGQLNLSAA